MSLRPRRAPSDELRPEEIREIRAAAAQEIKHAPPATPAQLALAESVAGSALKASLASSPHVGTGDAA